METIGAPPELGIGLVELIVLAVIGGGCLIGFGGLIAAILLVIKQSSKEK